MKEEISVRQWQKQFKAGFYDSPDIHTQCGAGWYDWFCQDRALAGRLKKIAKVVMGVTNPFILDHYYIWFKNNALVSGPMYDDVRFEPLSGKRDGKYFLVRLDCAGRKKWSLFSERYGFFAPEFECGNVRGMAKYIDGIGRQFAQEIQPVFLLEKRAVEHFITQQDGLCDSIVYRAGEHCYHYKSSKNPKLRTAIATSASGPPPDGFPADQAKEFRGILVWSPDGMERDMKKEADAQKKPNLKKKEGTER